MDPVMDAAIRFAQEVAEFLQHPNARALRLIGIPEGRDNIVKALRLLERAPDNRWPFFLVEEPFREAETYFAAVEASVARDYELVRTGVYEEGVRLPGLGSTPREDPMRRAAWTVARAADGVAAGGLDGALVGLLPRSVVDEEDFVTAARDWMRLPSSPRVRFAVLGSPSMNGRGFDGAARFEVQIDRLCALLEAASKPEASALRARLMQSVRPVEAVGATASVARLRGALESGVQALMADEVIAVRMALGGALLSAGARKEAREAFIETAGRAQRAGLREAAMQAWSIVQVLALQDGLPEVAERAQRALQEL